MIEVMATYGYLGLFFSVLVDELGLPLPSMLMIMAAGELVGLADLNFATTLILVVTTSLIANFVWFEIGRRRGISVLGVLCRYSLESDTCVRDTEKNSSGTAQKLYYTQNSSRFERDLSAISRYHQDEGFDILLWKYYIRRRLLKRIVTARITSLELKEMIDNGGLPMIVDLRHEIDFNLDPRMLPGTVRLSVDEIGKRHEELPRDREIILYCTCPNEAANCKRCYQASSPRN